MTGEELSNNYEFKIAKRSLMREFPWIKDVTFREEELNEYNTIFLYLTIDVTQVAKVVGAELTPWVKTLTSSGERYESPYISVMYNMSFDEGKQKINKPIIKLLDGIHDSPALPQDLRLPQGRRFSIGGFIANPTGTDDIERE